MSDKEKYSKNRRIGNIAEDTVVRYIERSGFTVLDRNYLRKIGEIDIVAQKDGIIHFIEVKSRTISREIDKKDQNIVSRIFSRYSFTNKKLKIEISRENSNYDDYRPEDNVHFHKQRNLLRVIEAYLIEKNIENDWQVDVFSVLLDFLRNTAIIKHIENVMLDA
ncbi:MAG: YraN family protein [Patescibacteria group bacterium]